MTDTIDIDTVLLVSIRIDTSTVTILGTWVWVYIVSDARTPRAVIRPRISDLLVRLLERPLAQHDAAIREQGAERADTE